MTIMDSLLDQSLNDVETAAEFVDLPNGEYTLHIDKAEPKEMPAKDDKPAGVRVAIIYSVVETLALADTTKEPVDEGSLASESFTLSEQGQTFFKRYLVNIFGETEGTSLGEAIQALNGMDINAVVRTRESGGRNYMSTSRQSQA